VVISYRRFGTTCQSYFRGQEYWSFKMGPIGCPKTSETNCHYSLRNNTEERSSHLLRGGSLKSRQTSLIVSTLSNDTVKCLECSDQGPDRLQLSPQCFKNEPDNCTFTPLKLLLYTFLPWLGTSLKNAVFWNVTPCNLLEIYSFSEEPSASTF